MDESQLLLRPWHTAATRVIFLWLQFSPDERVPSNQERGPLEIPLKNRDQRREKEKITREAAKILQAHIFSHLRSEPDWD